MQKNIVLDNVALVIIDGRDPQKALNTLLYNTKLGIKFKEAKLFTNKNIENLNADIEVIVTQSHELNDLNSYGDFLLTELHKFINTEFCLIIQTDGFIINANLWDFNFLLYDYIGAPWHGGLVGNGGFSLRSKKLLKACNEILKDLNTQCWSNEDSLVCRDFRNKLEGDYYCKFAPLEAANKFSKELCNMKSDTFGFHGKYKHYESYLHIVK